MNYRRADAWLLYCLSAFWLMTGASLWETAVFVPIWASARPGALTVLKGDVGMDAAYLWVSVHSIFEVILLFTLISNWNDRPRRNALLAFTFLYAVVRAWTILYFAPSFLTFQRLSANSQFANPLLEGVVRWKNLNLIRTSLVTGLNVAFLAYVINRLSSRNTRKVLTSKM
ncbi:MAG TPA: hypothetical protein VK716_15790 [Terracidiphilus sp.]|jgi:hypothetical protein|nr:hypothetical protein [Terracidiphilus sp.]